MGIVQIRMPMMGGLGATDIFLLFGTHCVASAVCVCVCCWVKQSGFYFLTVSHPLNYSFVSKSFYYKGRLLVLYCILCIEICILHNCIVHDCILLTFGLRFNVNNI
jgi:hypothetical protein